MFTVKVLLTVIGAWRFNTVSVSDSPERTPIEETGFLPSLRDGRKYFRKNPVSRPWCVDSQYWDFPNLKSGL